MIDIRTWPYSRQPLEEQLLFQSGRPRVPANALLATGLGARVADEPYPYSNGDALRRWLSTDVKPLGLKDPRPSEV